MHINRLLLLPLFLTIIFIYEGSDKENDSINNLKKSLSANLDDTLKLRTLSNLAAYYATDPSTLPLAQKYLEEAFSLAKDKDLEIPYRLFWTKADILYAYKNFSAAAGEMQKVIRKLSSTSNTLELVKARNVLARDLLYGGEFTESINTFNNTLEIANSHNLLNTYPSIYGGLSDVYNALGNTEEERKYLELYLSSALKINKKEAAATAYTRLGNIAMAKDSNFLKAIGYYKESLKIRSAMKDTLRAGDVMRTIGWNYYLTGQFDTALRYYFRSLEFSDPNKNLFGVANSYGNIGTIYRDKKDYSKALEYYQKSIDYSYKAQDWYNLSWLNQDMSDMYKSLGDFRKAYQHYVLYKQFSDSLKDQKYNTGLAEARMKFEADAKTKKLEVLSLKLNQQKYFTYGITGMLLLLLLIGLMFFRQSKMKSQRRLSEMNHKISEITQANLRQQMNPHFIFNTLNSIQYYMYQHDKISTNNYLTKFSSLMRKILENSQHTSIPIKDELDALQLYLELETLRFKEKFEYKLGVDEDIDTLLYKIPTMVIQPYVENAITHGLVNKEGKGFLKVDLKLFPDYIACLIEDNGIGREAALEIRKEKEVNHNSLGTKITESRLNLVNALYGTGMTINYTDLYDQQDIPAGTRVEIHIPIMT